MPPAVRDQVWLTFKKRANDFNLYENRPHFRDASTTTSMPIAKFRYDETNHEWALLWADRNDRWHPYFEDVGTTIESLLTEIDDDPTCIFWG